MSEKQPTIAVIGAGLSGTLLMANLLRYTARPLRIFLIERSGDFGPGVAYSTTDPQHRLNVPAARMSAFERAPLHLLTWASQHLGRTVEGSEYLPRRLYGEYLRALLKDECARAKAARVELLKTEAERIVRAGDGVLVELAGGEVLAADAAVLATGNLPPSPLPELPEDPRIVPNPWAPGALESLRPAKTTVIVGTALTAVDVALTVSRCSPKGHTIAISRSGRTPHTSLPGLREPAPPPNLPNRKMPLVAVDNFLRSHTRRMMSEGYDWREVVDGIRPCVPAFWACISIADRRRFVTEMAREWDTLRHRIAPDSKIELEWLRQEGRLKFMAARIAEAAPNEDCISLTLERSDGARQRIQAEQVICCTGVGADVNRVGGLIGRAIEDGIALPDPLGLGLRAGSCGALVDQTGSARGPIYTLGPPLRGELWETTAAREIRIQAEEVALDLCRGLNVAPPPADEMPTQPTG